MFLVLFYLLLLPLIQTKQNSLRFAPEQVSFVEFPTEGISLAEHTICLWIKQESRGSPTLFTYREKKYPGIFVGVNSYYSNISGVDIRLQVQDVIPMGEWVHVCRLCWSWNGVNRKLVVVVHIDGEERASVETQLENMWDGENIMSGGDIGVGIVCLGNKLKENLFGGEMFQLKIFNRVLTKQEIGKIASNICASEEMLELGSEILRWEEVLMKRRRGEVKEVFTGCRTLKNESEEIRKLRELLRSTELELAETKLNLTNLMEEQGGGKILKILILTTIVVPLNKY